MDGCIDGWVDGWVDGLTLCSRLCLVRRVIHTHRMQRATHGGGPVVLVLLVAGLLGLLRAHFWHQLATSHWVRGQYLRAQKPTGNDKF